MSRVGRGLAFDQNELLALDSEVGGDEAYHRNREQLRPFCACERE